MSEEAGAVQVNSGELSGETVASTAEATVASPPRKTSSGGIFDGGFEAYRTVTQEEYRSLLTSGLVVLDANALLNLYRYNVKTRDDFIEMLANIRERLWVPHQAMYEFWRGRSSVIGSRSREIEGIIDGILRNRSNLEKGIHTWSGRVGLPPEKTAEIIGTVESAVDDVAEKIRATSNDTALENAEDTAKDPVITALSTILETNVGYPLTADELRKAKAEAMKRIADHAPPGWKYARKRENPEGDYIVWFEALQEARRRGVDVLFVTDDTKDDWWRKEGEEVKGPLPELVYEMRVVANVGLFMLRPGSLLAHAGDALGLGISKESVQDAERVSIRMDLLAASIDNDWERDEVFAGLVKALTLTDPDRAELLAQSIEGEATKGNALFAIVRALAASDPDRAELLAQSIDDRFWKASALADIVRALAVTDPDRAELLAQSIDSEFSKGNALAAIVRTLVVTDPDRAELLAQSIDDENWKSSALVFIVRALAVTDPDRAELLAQSIDDEQRKAIALDAIAKARAATDPTPADVSAQSITSESVK
jgi:hypothetical protein